MSAEAELGYCVQQIRARIIGPVVHRQYRQRQRWDPGAEHHLVLTFVSSTGEIAVSCGCLRLPGGGHKPIEVRRVWDPDSGDQLRVWRAHLGEET